MSTEIPPRNPVRGELDFGINTESVLTLATQFRKSGQSWPKSLADGLGMHICDQLERGAITERHFAAAYYSNYLDNIGRVEKIIREGPEPGSDLIRAWTTDVAAHAEYYAEVHDKQLTDADALINDPTGIKLLSIKLQELPTFLRALGPSMEDAINSLVSGTRDFDEISWDEFAMEKADNIRAYCSMRAFDDYRRLVGNAWEKLYLIDSAVEVDSELGSTV